MSCLFSATRLVSYPGDEGDEGNILDDSTEMGEDAMEVVTEEQDGEETSNDNVQVSRILTLENLCFKLLMALFILWVEPKQVNQRCMYKVVQYVWLTLISYD